MTKTNGNGPRIYSVYAYVFSDGHTYVGLTIDPVRRHSEHSTCANSAVHRYWKENWSGHFPDMTVLCDRMTASEAQTLEDMLVSAVDHELKLNTAYTGEGTGSLGVPDMSEKRLIEMRVKNARRNRSGLRTRFAVYGKARLSEFQSVTHEQCREALALLRSRACKRDSLYAELLSQTRNGNPIPDSVAWCRSRALVEQT